MFIYMSIYAGKAISYNNPMKPPLPRPQSKQPIPESAKCVYKGDFFQVFAWQQPQFDLTVKTFEKIKRPDSVNLIAVTQDNRILLANQQQPGIKPFTGCLGGVVDPNEDPETTARRELLEESGYQAGRLIFWDSVQPWTKIECAVYTFIAKDLEKVSEPKLDSGEKIQLVSVTFDEFLEQVAQETFRDSEIALKIFRLSRNPVKMAAFKSMLMG
jgi:ADP-ribose pyrophosphatase